MSSDAVTLRLLGPPVIEGPDGPIDGPVNQRLRVALLARLAGAFDRGVSREHLVGLFWAESKEAKARHALSNALYAIRQSLGDDSVVVRGEILTLGGSRVSVDLWQFRAAMEEGRLEDADRLYRGPLLDGLPTASAEFERWVDRERAELSRLHAGALETLATSARDQGRLDDSARWWRQLADQESLNARVALELIRALARAGDEAAALRHAATYAELRASELGAGPHSDVEDLAEKIRRGTWSAAPMGPSGEASVNQETGRGALAIESRGPFPDHAPSREAPGIPSVAVLPFTNDSPDPANEFLSDGIADETIYALSVMGNMSVAARSSSWAFKGQNPDLREVGRKLGVRAIVEGSVRREDTRTRVTVRLVDAESGYQIWSSRYDHDGADLFRIQDEVAEDIALNCHARLRLPVLHRHSSDPEAYEFYLRGRQAMAEATPGSYARAAQRFEAAINRDGAYAEAYAALSEAATSMITGISLEERQTEVKRARRAAKIALELDDTVARAYLAEGKLAMYCDWEPSRALSLFQTALDLNPGLAEAHHWRVALLSFYRDDPDLAALSLAEGKRVDPLGVMRQMLEAVYWQNRGESDRSHRVLMDLQDQEPRHPVVPMLLGLYHAIGDEPEDALGYLQRSSDFGGSFPMGVVARAIAVAKLGRVDDARDLALSPLLDGRPALAACACYWGQDPDGAFTLLDEAVATRDPTLIYALGGATFQALRADSRFPHIVERMGLDPDEHARIPAAR